MSLKRFDPDKKPYRYLEVPQNECFDDEDQDTIYQIDESVDD